MSQFEHVTRELNGVTYTWPIEVLWQQAEELDIELVFIEEIKALDSNRWFEGRVPTLRELVPHVERIMEADPHHPVLLMNDGWVLDGRHRIAKAVMLEMDIIPAKRFSSMPHGYVARVAL